MIPCKTPHQTEDLGEESQRLRLSLLQRKIDAGFLRTEEVTDLHLLNGHRAISNHRLVFGFQRELRAFYWDRTVDYITQSGRATFFRSSS